MNGDFESTEEAAAFWADLAREVETWPKLSPSDFADDPEPLL